MMVKQSLLFLSFVLCVSAQSSEASLRAGREFQQLDEALDKKQEMMEQSQNEESMNKGVGRRLTGWLTLIMEVGPGSCAHQPDKNGHYGPLHQHCKNIAKKVSGGGGSGGGSSSSSSSGGTSGDSSSGSSSSGGTSGDSSSGSSSSGGTSSGGTSDAATGADSNGGANSGNPLSASAATTFSFSMMALAALAVAGAVGAAVIGSRKREVKPHPLSGSVMRRLHLFSNFADKSLCDGAERNRAPRVVEMVDSGDGTPYRLA